MCKFFNFFKSHFYLSFSFIISLFLKDVVPGVYTSSKNVIKNSRKVRRSGNGKEGWEMLENIKERRKSY